MSPDTNQATEKWIRHIAAGAPRSCSSQPRRLRLRDLRQAERYPLVPTDASIVVAITRMPEMMNATPSHRNGGTS